MVDAPSDLKSLHDRVTFSLLNVTRTAGQISSQDLGFHRSSSSVITRSLDAQNAHLLQLTQKLLQAAIITTSPGIDVLKFQDVESIDDHWRGLVDILDDLLENADACLDEYSGVIKRGNLAFQDDGARPEIGYKNKSKGVPSGLPSHKLPKPQLLFERPPANNEVAPFKPLLREKPHSMVELKDSLVLDEHDGYQHPYAAEVRAYAYPNKVLQYADPEPYSAATASEAVFVDTKEGVHEMLQELLEAQEIAVDLEHHSAHSFIGIVCLMQISTRHKDWIVDTLVPWREDLQILNRVFADPRILKVFHGASMDIVWLQRDLGLYVVGLFDTFHASMALNFPQKSLRYLLQRFCDFQADKKHQLADWRMRPIPQDMLEYARSDTHYLLFVYDHLRNMLIQETASGADLVRYVLDKSKREALQRYQRPIYDVEKGLGNDGWFYPLTQKLNFLTKEQLSVYRAVHQWRDQTARRLDEGLTSVMNGAVLWAIAEIMPATVPALLEIAQRVSGPVKVAASDLVKIIKHAKEIGHDGPTMAEIMNSNDAFVPRQRIHTRPPKSQAEGGLAATFQKIQENGDVNGHAERTKTSLFWGSISNDGTDPVDAFQAPYSDALRLVLPLPPKDALSFSTRAQIGSLEQAVDTAAKNVASLTPTKDNSIGDAFVLKELARPVQRANEPQALSQESGLSKVRLGSDGRDLSPASYHIDDTIAEVENIREREISRVPTKSVPPTTTSKKCISPIQPFDYANAPSVLHAKANGFGSNNPDNNAPQRRFNLSAKALDAPRGVKRPRGEAGKSFTFKQ